VRLRQLVTALEERGASPRFTATTIVLQGAVADRTLTLGSVEPVKAELWFDNIVQQAAALGRRDAALAYYHSLASLVRDPVLRTKKLSPDTKTGTASLPLDDLLSQQEAWLAAGDTYLGALRDATNNQG